MKRLEVSGAVRPIYGSLGVKRLIYWLLAGPGNRIPVEAIFSAPVQTGTGTHPTSCTKGTVSFPGVKSGLDETLTLPLWAVRPVQSLSACTRVHFTFTLL